MFAALPVLQESVYEISTRPLAGLNRDPEFTFSIASSRSHATASPELISRLVGSYLTLAVCYDYAEHSWILSSRAAVSLHHNEELHCEAPANVLRAFRRDQA